MTANNASCILLTMPQAMHMCCIVTEVVTRWENFSYSICTCMLCLPIRFQKSLRSQNYSVQALTLSHNLSCSVSLLYTTPLLSTAIIP